MPRPVVLPRGGREYLTADVDGVPDNAPLEVTVDGATWVPTQRLPGQLRFLAPTPEAPGNPADTLVIPAGVHAVRVRLVDNPEIVLEHAGVVEVPRH